MSHFKRMTWAWLPLIVACVAANTFAQTLPKPASGRIERIENFPSTFVDARHVDVWLPAGYRADKRYDVLYMHDDQMLFDATTTWNKQAWSADVPVAKLSSKGLIADTIIVGIWNNPAERYAEYYPQKVLALAPEAVQREYEIEASNGRLKADAYLRFVVEELKPAIDKRYPTRPGRANTFIAGSSMGGMISLYALCEYPHVFGGAAALSTHWVGKPTAWGRERVRNAALPLAAMTYLGKNLPDPATHRIYSDRGDDWLDSLYAPAHRLLVEVLRERGYTAANAMTAVVDGTGHSESDWAARLDQALLFVMGKR